MRQDALARRDEPDAQGASDYDALCAALNATARGRAFLDEHARRARQAETGLALETLTRLETLLRQRDDEAEAKVRLRSELRALLSAVVSARANFGRFEGMLAKRETVMALFDMLEQRVTEMLDDAPAEIEPPANENEVLAQAAEAITRTASVEAARPVIETAEPPSPVPPRESRDQELQAPESVTLDSRLRGNEREQGAPQAKTAAVISQPEMSPPSRVAPAPAQQSDIIARINALTPAERIALFS